VLRQVADQQALDPVFGVNDLPRHLYLPAPPATTTHGITARQRARPDDTQPEGSMPRRTAGSSSAVAERAARLMGAAPLSHLPSVTGPCKVMIPWKASGCEEAQVPWAVRGKTIRPLVMNRPEPLMPAYLPVPSLSV
jgi:hypothetical protein